MKKRGALFKISKKGQVTIFIILGIIIIAAAILLYFLYPQVKTAFGISVSDPQQFIQSCMHDKISQVISTISLQGGSMTPDNYFLYNNNQVEYLCYTNKNYQACVMQQPLLQAHIDSEIGNNIQQSVSSCFGQLQGSYESQGYSVNLNQGNTTVDLLPNKVVVTFNNALTLTKGGNSQRYDKFSVVLNNNLYELVAISNSILNWEVQYGDAPITTYMALYHNMIVQQKIQDDGTKIYILTDLNTGSTFQFATRSFVFPSGYGVANS